MSAGWAGQAGAQTSEVKEKPTLYTYVADWNIPREKWGDMEKSYAGTQKMLDKAVADGTIVGYGSDVTLVHQGDGVTHDDWWSAMSLAGVLYVLDQLEKASDSAGFLCWPVPPTTSITYTKAGTTTGIQERRRTATPMRRLIA